MFDFSKFLKSIHLTKVSFYFLIFLILISFSITFYLMLPNNDLVKNPQRLQYFLLADVVFVILRHDDHPLSPLASLASINMGNGLNINDRQIDVTSSDHCQPETRGVKGSLQPMKVRPDAKAGVKKGGTLYGKTVKYGVRKNRVVKLYPHKITKKIGRHNYYVLWKTTRKNLPGKTYHYKFFNTKEGAKDHISKRKKTRKRK